MCGLFAYAGRRADPELLVEAAIAASRRGPDAWGWQSQERGVRELGRPDRDAIVAGLDAYRGGCLVGHFRLATVGESADQLEDIQPLTVGGWAVAVNGVIPDHHRAARERGVSLQTRNDCEVAAALCARVGVSRMVGMLGLTRYAVVAVDGRGGLHVARQGLPLHVVGHWSGRYYASGGMPGSRLIREAA